jgi:hypothetical protein
MHPYLLDLKHSSIKKSITNASYFSPPNIKDKHDSCSINLDSRITSMPIYHQMIVTITVS